MRIGRVLEMHVRLFEQNKRVPNSVPERWARTPDNWKTN